MTGDCPFCAQPVAPRAMVCSSCSRDISIPESLIAERDDLVRKRALAGEELAHAKAELETLRRRQRLLLRRN
jgi:hypothetical protein